MQPRFELTLDFDSIPEALDAWNAAAGSLYATRDRYVRVTATAAWISLSVEERSQVVVLRGVYDSTCSRAVGDSAAAWRTRVVAMARYLDEVEHALVAEPVFHDVELVDVAAE